MANLKLATVGNIFALALKVKCLDLLLVCPLLHFRLLLGFFQLLQLLLDCQQPLLVVELMEEILVLLLQLLNAVIQPVGFLGGLLLQLMHTC